MTLYGKRHVPVVPGPEAFRLQDTYVISQEIPRPEELPVDTLAGGLSWTGVMRAIEEAPQSHAKGRKHRAPMPVWPVALIVAGLSLMALAVVTLTVVVPLRDLLW